jgi:2-succinyl-6-hydroxy-2,4-cyclohexadiene-1-carboxylate synthase
MEGASRAGSAPQPRAMQAYIEHMGHEAYWRRARAKLLAMDPVAFNTLGDAFGSWPGVVARLGEIDCPTTVLVGEEDVPFTAPADELAEGIAGARLEVIARAAHSPQVEHPEAWLAAVTAHLERARSGG